MASLPSQPQGGPPFGTVDRTVCSLLRPAAGFSVSMRRVALPPRRDLHDVVAPPLSGGAVLCCRQHQFRLPASIGLTYGPHSTLAGRSVRTFAHVWRRPSRPGNAVPSSSFPGGERYFRATLLFVSIESHLAGRLQSSYSLGSARHVLRRPQCLRSGLHFLLTIVHFCCGHGVSIVRNSGTEKPRGMPGFFP
jgi:hypothetical protein